MSDSAEVRVSGPLRALGESRRQPLPDAVRRAAGTCAQHRAGRAGHDGGGPDRRPADRLDRGDRGGYRALDRRTARRAVWRSRPLAGCVAADGPPPPVRGLRARAHHRFGGADQRTFARRGPPPALGRGLRRGWPGARPGGAGTRVYRDATRRAVAGAARGRRGLRFCLRGVRDPFLPQAPGCRRLAFVLAGD